MITFVLAFMVLALVMAAMAIGLILRNKPIKGTCASLSQLTTDDGECVVCGKKMEEQVDCQNGSPAVIKQRLYHAADSQ